MDLKMSIGRNLLFLLIVCIGTITIGVTARPQSHRHHQQNHHARQYDNRHHHHHHHHQTSHIPNSDPTSTNNNNDNNNDEETVVAGRMSGTGGVETGKSGHHRDDDYDYDDEGDRRHEYLMTPNNVQKPEVKDEDDAITSAFEKHMRPNHHNHHDGASTSTKNSQPPPEHDVYAYQLPSSLWFIVRYAKDPDGHMEKYMNIVDSFSNYLEKLEKVRTVSVNDLKGVETVFRLTPQHKPFRLH